MYEIIIPSISADLKDNLGKKARGGRIIGQNSYWLKQVVNGRFVV